jgi:putative oxidoreductase
MKSFGLFLLRVSMGWLLVLWGIDKLTNVEHSVRVAESFYFGIGSGATVLTAFGVAEILVGALVILGLLRKFVYPIQTLVAALTAIGVWKSIVDPWGWALEGTNALFYPSLIVFAGAIVLMGFMEEDALSLDARRTAQGRL